MEAEELQRRKPVWLALSEFYLDTELQPADFAHIRAVFDRSGYSIDELRQINYCEVSPVLLPNLLGGAGEWAGFEERALIELITKRRNKKAISSAIPPLAWLWRRYVDSLTGRYFQQLYAAD